MVSLRGRRLKGKGKGVLGARETRGAREEGGREGNACQETIVFLVFNIHQCSLQIMEYRLNSPFALGLSLGSFSSCYLLIVHSGPVVPSGQTQV